LDHRQAEDEPFGHQGYFSKIERAWQGMPAGTALNRRRVSRFDTVSSVLYAPIEYEYPFVADKLSCDEPTNGWIREQFVAFVRGEFGSSDEPRPLPSRFAPDVSSERTVGLAYLEEYLEICEADLIYHRLAARGTDQDADDQAGAIFEVLCDPFLGHKKNRTNVLVDEFRSAIDEQLRRRDRLLFLLPSFPFKDQNRFRTFSGASTVDMGEISMLVRLHALALALYQKHPFGADIVILSDGLLYSSVFGVEDTHARRYREQLRGFRNLLNLQGTVSILDLKELIDHFSVGTETNRVIQVIDLVRSFISDFEGSQGECGEAFAVLKKGMKWNMNTRDRLAHLDDEAAWCVLTESHRHAVPTRLTGDWDSLDRDGAFAASSYAAVNLALKYFDLVNLVFPGAFRATVHPKPGQLAVPIVGGVYPWNGVGMSMTSQLSARSVETHPLHALPSQSFRLVRLDMTGEPLLFEGGA
jgi:L-tyrosine isonitrile synthase